MVAVNAPTCVTHEGPLTLASRHHLINTSVLQSGAQPLSALGFLILSDTQPLIARIHPVPEQWQDVSVINSQQDGFFRWLKSVGVAERVHGDVGRRAKLPGSSHLFGEVDYGPGLWLHSDLVLPYARWMAAKLVPPQKTPLISFLEKHLQGPALARAIKPKSVAIAFAGEVSRKAMKDLEAVDKLMIADGVSAAERTEVLRARVDAMQEA